MKNKCMKFTTMLLIGGSALVLSACGGGTSDSGLITLPPSIGGSNDSTGILPQIKIASVEKKRTFTAFATNKAEKPTNKRIEFIDRSKNYAVGTDNKFNVKPIVRFINESLDPIEVPNWTYQIELEKLDGENYVAATLTDYTETIDLATCDIDFNEAAQNATFRVTVTPDGLSNKQLENIKTYQAIMIFDVMEGYNIYKAEELAYFDNRVDYTGDPWKNFKTAKGMNLDLQPTNFIIHDNIIITKNDLPKEFFYNEGDSDLSTSDADYQRTLGSLRDGIDIYMHKYDETAENVQIRGNYFTLNAETIPNITRKWGEITPEGKVNSHTALFKTEASEANVAVNNSFTMSELSFVGNAAKVDNVLKAGGLILHKNTAVKVLMRNNLTRCWFITYFSLQGDAHYEILKAKAYDSFSCFIYNYGGRNVTVTDSEMIGAGGPVVIQDHTDTGREYESVGQITITNSNVQSLVAGTEGWFDLYGASAIVPQIKGMNALFTPFGKSFLKTDTATSATLFNLICVNKSGNAEGITNETIRGKTTINNNPAFDFGTYDENSSPVLAGFIAAVNAATGGQAPIFQSCVENGYSFTNGEALIGMDMQPITSNSHPMFTGEYLGMYYSGMCFTMGYFTV